MAMGCVGDASHLRLWGLSAVLPQRAAAGYIKTNVPVKLSVTQTMFFPTDYLWDCVRCPSSQLTGPVVMAQMQLH